MLQTEIDQATATPVQRIELQILAGLADCKPVYEIAEAIVKTLAHPANRAQITTQTPAV